MTGDEPCAALGAFSTGTLCDAHPQVRALDSAIMPLFRGAAFSGTARTAMTPPDHNAAIHRALHTAREGDVLVIDGGGGSAFGLFGDILAAACIRRGVRGCVIDGTVRDTAGICAMCFPVFCRGVNAAGAGKSDPGEVNAEIVCGGVAVCPDDFVIGDDDGVVVVPRELGPQVVARAEEVVRREREIIRRVGEGESTCEILGITP
ncbi:MAG: RraA family protein [Alphaproteobacteria bacterium]